MSVQPEKGNEKACSDTFHELVEKLEILRKKLRAIFDSTKVKTLLTEN